MTEPRWEWLLPGGARVAATLTSSSGVESVFVGEKLASQSPRGAKPAGHALTVRRPEDDGGSEALRVTVKFEPRVQVCVLRVDGEEVAPSVWPVAGRAAARPLARRPFPLGLVLVLAAVAAIGGGGYFAWGALKATRVTDKEMSGVHRADNGLFVARFPPSLETRPAVTPIGMSGLVLVDEAHSDAIVILALPSSEASRDPWLLQKRLHGEGLANVPRGDGKYEETSRRDDTCLGEPGAVVVGRVTNRKGAPARLWSCAFNHADAGYLVMSSVRDTAPPDDEKKLRRVIDATELTRLGAVSAPPK